MTEKERLANLLLQMNITDLCDKTCWCESCDHFGNPDMCNRHCAKQTAERLMNNGVRFGGWISVKDELPEHDTQVFVATDEKGEVAYWMPIPPLPEGCSLP